MTSTGPPGLNSDDFWRDFLTRGQSSERQLRRVLKHLPSERRCSMCAAPFSGVGAPAMRLIGKRPSQQSPRMCNSCFTFMAKHHGGAEIEVSFLFADVRGSTTIAEGLSAADFRDLMDRFYTTAMRVVFDHDGGVDKFVGDELMAMFFPLLTGDRHAARAVEAAVALLEATGHRDRAGPWIPLGAGVGTGTAWVGSVGEGSRTEMTALSDIVNTTARLSSAAKAGGSAGPCPHGSGRPARHGPREGEPRAQGQTRPDPRRPHTGGRGPLGPLAGRRSYPLPRRLRTSSTAA